MSRILTVKVHPKARRNEVRESEGAYTVWTTAAPDKGEANNAVRKLLADHFGCSQSKISLKRGAINRNKVFELED